MTKGTDKKKKKTVVQSVPVLAKCSVIFSTKRLFKYSFCVCSPKLKTYQQYKKEVLFFFFLQCGVILLCQGMGAILRRICGGVEKRGPVLWLKEVVRLNCF